MSAMDPVTQAAQDAASFDSVGIPLDYMGDFYFFLQFFAALFVIDTIMVRVIKWFPEKSSATRYFSIHVLVNAYVVYVHWKDVVATYTLLHEAYLGPTDTRGSIAIFALHLYHICFFQPLDFIDWLHHIVMVLVMLPLGYGVAPGHMLGHGCFYSSGLPGGVDYLLLVLIKCNVITKMQEKKWNVWIQNWIRAPGCLIQAWLTYHNYCDAMSRMDDPSIPNRLPHSTLPIISTDKYGRTVGLVTATVVVLTFYWNGQFFLERVIRSHERNVVMDEMLSNIGMSRKQYSELAKKKKDK